VGPYKNDGSYNINGGTIGQGNNLSVLAFTNPVMLNDLNRFESNTERVLGNVYAQIRIVNGLSFKTLYGIDHLTVENEEFRNALHGDGQQFNGAAQNTIQRPFRWNWQNTLTYDTHFGDHNLNVLVGAEQQSTLTNSWGADRRNQTDPFFDEFQGGFIDIVPAGNTYAQNFLQSYFGRVNYDYKRKYLLSFNARRDGYSAFSKKWGNFYGGSAGWSISEENFWKTASISKTISTLKLRGSYGMVGNFAGIGSYPYQTLFTGGLYGSNGAIFFNQAGNEDLTWEKSKKLDLGFTVGILRDRFTAEFAYYKNDINDLILAEPQSPSRGIPGNSILRNVGSMENKGIEVTLAGTIISGKDFSWNANFNITTLKNKVTALSNNNADILISTGGLESPSLVRVGESIGSFLAVKTTGINPANGQRIFLMKDGTQVQYNHGASAALRWTKVSDGTAIATPPNQVTDGVVVGPALPKYFGGFENTFRYKGFDLNILLYFCGGNYVYNGSKAGLHDNRNWNNAADNLDRWTKAGQVTDWPRVVFGDNVSNGSALVISSNVEKGDFIKGRNIALGYTLPLNLVNRAKISNVRIYVAALNAFTITKYSGFDPETQSNGESVANQVTNGAPGVDRNAAPLARTFNFGVNIGF
jgi:TonB-linked SusC/RagA family outer membrane protein